MSLAACVAVLLGVQSAQDPRLPVLRPGQAVRGEIREHDPAIHTEQLDRDYRDAPVRGRSYTLQIAEAGEYTIDLRSHFFDAYLVVRDAGSRDLEDDDGLLLTHARLVARLVAGEFDALTFTSPSTVRNFTALLDEDSRAAAGRCLIAAIGPVTAEALRVEGLAPDVLPARAGAAELVEALAAHVTAPGGTP